VTELTDGSENVLNRYRAFGKPLISSESVKNVYEYTGRRSEADTGQLHYNRKRYYMVKYGRFMNWDPIRSREATCIGMVGKFR
jgi:RHS repeat-associated protein